MIKNKFKKIIGVIIVSVFVSGFIFYKPIEEYLVGQSANPTGFIGSVMTKIWNSSFDNMSKWGISKIDINEKDYILDVGCGGGKTLDTLSGKAEMGKVFGIDISEESVKTSIKENKKNIDEGKVEVLLADVAELPFDNDYFNKVTAIQTHIYWDRIEKGFEEIFRVLKKDGELIIICEKDKIEYHLKEEYRENYATKELLYNVGFDEVRIEENGNWVAFICKKS